MGDLDRAIKLAVDAHSGQTRTNGTPYILHPMRVMLSMEGESAMVTAILHDVIEDTAVTLADIEAAGFAAEIVEALALLTHEDDMSYRDYIAQLAPNPLARQVKLADLEDNLNLRELPKLRQSHLDRVAKYHRAWRALKAAEAQVDGETG